MRWSEAITLLGQPRLTQDSSGNVIEAEPERRDVFCNQYTLGADAWATAVDIGLRADASVQVRSCDYNGEDEAIYHDVEYDIERVTASGEFTLLQLGRHVSNG